MQPYLKEVNKQTEVTVSEDGELLDIESKSDTILVQSKEEYFTIYSRIIGVLKDLHGADIKVMSYLVMNAPLGTNIISIGKGYRELLSKELDIKESTVRKSILNLAEKKILIKFKENQKSGDYYINPNYYWKGNMTDRNKAMKFLLELKYLP